MDRATLPPVPAVISISGLAKTYASGLQALKRIDLEIARARSSPCSARTAPARRCAGYRLTSRAVDFGLSNPWPAVRLGP
jgi:hypothetical protein